MKREPKYSLALKKRLDAVFRELRKDRLLAHQSFRCCSSCASYELHQKIQKIEENNSMSVGEPGTYKHGYVYYHKQDTEFLNETGKVYLRFSGVTESDVDVGQQVCFLLSKLHIPYEWDFNPMNAILVDLREPPCSNPETP